MANKNEKKIIKWGLNVPLDIDKGRKEIKNKKELLEFYNTDLLKAEKNLANEKARVAKAKNVDFKICPITGAKLKVKVKNDIDWYEEEVAKLKEDIANVDSFITEKYFSLKKAINGIKEDIIFVEKNMFEKGWMLVELDSYYFKFDNVKDWRIKAGEEIDLNGYEVIKEYGFDIKVKIEKDKLIWTFYIASVVKDSYGYDKKRRFSVRVKDSNNENEKLVFSEDNFDNYCKITSYDNVVDLAIKRKKKEIERLALSLVRRRTNYINSLNRMEKKVKEMEEHIVK